MGIPPAAGRPGPRSFLQRVSDWSAVLWACRISAATGIAAAVCMTSCRRAAIPPPTRPGMLTCCMRVGIGSRQSSECSSSGRAAGSFRRAKNAGAIGRLAVIERAANGTAGGLPHCSLSDLARAIRRSDPSRPSDSWLPSVPDRRGLARRSWRGSYPMHRHCRGWKAHPTKFIGCSD